jgi:hypothetical protein
MFKKMIAATLGIAAIALVFLAPKFLNAEAQNATRTVTLIPPSFELPAFPGGSISETLRIRNESEVEGNFQITVENFRATGEDGNVDLYEDDDDSTFSLAKWVTVEPKNLTIGPKQEKTVKFTINVPRDAEPGGHYGSILVKMGGDQPVEGGAQVSSRVGSLILLRVDGNVSEVANVESFISSKGYYNNGPVELELRVKNTGNNHIRPSGKILITNIFGQKVDEIDLDGRNVLPGAIRKMTTEWKPSGLVANRYTATLVATYGIQNNKTLSESTSFVVFPKTLAVGLFAGLFGLVLMAKNKKKIKKFLHKLTK